MKLRNKKTGEITPPINEFMSIDLLSKYRTLKEFNEEWEDYNETKTYFINAVGHVDINDLTDKRTRENFYKQLKQIGNYFDTREDAEKAVEKLKAYKRLKDEGISFEVKVINRKWYLAPKAEQEYRTFDDAHDIFKDIMFVFGGEE